jgi:CRP-like cAMP-binding protein
MTHKQFTVAAGDAIFREGDKGDYMYVIVEGQVQIRKEVSGKPVVLATLNPGAFFGEMAIVDHTERTATALALSDTTVAAIPATQLETLLTQRPELGAKMLRTLVRRLIFTTNQVIDEKEKLAMLFSQELGS